MSKNFMYLFKMKQSIKYVRYLFTLVKCVGNHQIFADLAKLAQFDCTYIYCLLVWIPCDKHNKLNITSTIIIPIVLIINNRARCLLNCDIILSNVAL